MIPQMSECRCHCHQVLVTNQQDLFVTVVGKRITAFPDTGTIASVERLQPISTLTGGLHNTAAFSVNASRTRRVIVNVMPMSADDEHCARIADAHVNLGKVAGITVTYKGTTYVSGSVMVESEPIRNFLADGTEVIGWPFHGIFQIAKLVRLVNAQALTAADLEA